MTTALPRRPVLRPGVVMDVDDERADLSYRDGGCVIDLDRPTAGPARRFLEALRAGGATREELGARFPELPVTDVIDQLDAFGLLADAPAAAPAGLSGAQAYRRARRCYLSTMSAATELYPRQLSTSLMEGRATRAQLVGYAVEYYQVVAHCPQVLAPALAQAGDNVSTTLLRDFYRSEMNHDRMLLRSLAAVGVDPVALGLQPLPSTFAMMASLGVLAATFPLGLKAVLFVLEEPQPEFNDAFVAESRRLGLPDAFVRPIAQHSDVNEGESHDDISADLFDRVGFVSAEEMTEIEKAVSDMAEQLAAAGQEMADWYGAADEPRLRTS